MSISTVNFSKAKHIAQMSIKVNDMLMRDEINVCDIIDFEKMFFENKDGKGMFAIYQLKRGDEYDSIRFLTFDSLARKNIKISRDSYDCVICNSLSEVAKNILKSNTKPADPREIMSTKNILEEIYHMTNYTTCYIPAITNHRGTYIGDVIGLNMRGKVEYYYVDPDDYIKIWSNIDNN